MVQNIFTSLVHSIEGDFGGFPNNLDESDPEKVFSEE